MTVGRTTWRWARLYMDGSRIASYASKFGPMGTEFEEVSSVTMADAVQGMLLGQAKIPEPVLNGVFDNDTAGLFVLASPGSSLRQLMVAIGQNAEPAAGDRIWTAQLNQKTYTAAPAGGAVVANVGFSGWDAAATTLLYAEPWGTLLHADGAEMAANTAVGIDDWVGPTAQPSATSTAKGGLFVYQVFSGNGTATLSVEDAAANTNPSFVALSGATSGSINCAVASGGMIALGNTATVRRYLRFQIAFGTATTVTFASGLLRNFGN